MTKGTTAREIPLAHGVLNGCFGCGDDNAAGLHLKFFLDEEDRLLCRVHLATQFQGPPGHAHGGIIATLLDEAMSKANRRRNIVAMTRHMSIDYLRPVPLESDLILEGWSESDLESRSGRKHRCSAELRNSSEPCSRLPQPSSSRSRRRYCTVAVIESCATLMAQLTR